MTSVVPVIPYFVRSIFAILIPLSESIMYLIKDIYLLLETLYPLATINATDRT